VRETLVAKSKRSCSIAPQPVFLAPKVKLNGRGHMSSMEDVGSIHRKKVVRLAKCMTKKPHAMENYCSASQLLPKFRVFLLCGWAIHEAFDA
jgi:hypothetical protein